MTVREKKALQLFASGDNCAQSVMKAYGDLAGLTEEQAALVAVGFGGGMGRLRQNCGAFSAAVMLCGALEGPDGADKAKRTQVYARVQEVHRRFLEEMGTTQCGELLGRSAEAPRPEERTAAYYASRPCARIILQACRIIEEQLQDREENKLCEH